MAVYFMQMGEGGPIKIGHAADPFRRRTAFQTVSIAKVEILAIIDGGREAEQAVHRQFAHSHIRGELFSPSADLLEHIQAMPPHVRPAGKRRGRPQINEEQTPARFPAGTLGRIDAVLEDGESRAELIRKAVERELKRRERH
jgi:Meiotically Up-regulated Gene 113 (MUG113) protein